MSLRQNKHVGMCMTAVVSEQPFLMVWLLVMDTTAELGNIMFTAKRSGTRLRHGKRVRHGQYQCQNNQSQSHRRLYYPKWRVAQKPALHSLSPR